MVRNIVISCILFFATTALNAQETENIFTDRPDQSESPMTMYKHFVQLEIGFKYQDFKVISEKYPEYSFSMPEILIRYGLISDLELRFGAEYVFQRFTGGIILCYVHDLPPDRIYGIKPPSLGVKYRFFKGNDFIPMSALIISSELPGIGHTAFRLIHFNPELKLAMTNTISSKTDITYNIGASWDTEENIKEGFLSLSFGYSPTSVSSLFAETYVNLPEKKDTEFNFDFGFSYTLCRNMQIDFYYGIGLQKRTPYYAGIGYSVRLPE